MTDEDIFAEFASAFGWPDELTADATSTLMDLFPNAESAAELEEEVFGF